MRIEERVEKVLAKLKLQPFYPFPFARSGFWQTIYGAYWPILKPSKPDFYHYVALPDGDILVVAENRPKTWQPGQRIMLMVHGLGGSHQAWVKHAENGELGRRVEVNFTSKSYPLLTMKTMVRQSGIDAKKWIRWAGS